uniref:Uncharacterized protein n=1 Tax=Amphimedon queenslandica TaxID=400682 RepID=A0A1X7TWZ0_AMPQE
MTTRRNKWMRFQWIYHNNTTCPVTVNWGKLTYEGYASYLRICPEPSRTLNFRIKLNQNDQFQNHSAATKRCSQLIVSTRPLCSVDQTTAFPFTTNSTSAESELLSTTYQHFTVPISILSPSLITPEFSSTNAYLTTSSMLSLSSTPEFSSTSVYPTTLSMLSLSSTPEFSSTSVYPATSSMLSLSSTPEFSSTSVYPATSSMLSLSSTLEFSST